MQTGSGSQSSLVVRQGCSNPGPVSDSPISPDPFAREVYWVLGVPVDCIRMCEALHRLASAMERRQRLLFATPNLNFLILAQTDTDFQKSLVLADLSLPDGMVFLCLSRLLGVPLRERVAGSDLFDELKSARRAKRVLTVFMFGGAPGIGEAARGAINSESDALRCVGTLCPGFGTVDEMSSESVIGSVNASGADFLMVSLGAAKGQAWLMKNHCELTIPVQAHLGATLNFQAGSLARAPDLVRRLGFEWLWRIKEEPYLWRRYFDDGRRLFQTLLRRVAPLMFHSLMAGLKGGDLWLEQADEGCRMRVRLTGSAVARHISSIQIAFRRALNSGKPVLIDMSRTRIFDARFLGALMVLKISMRKHGLPLQVVGLSSSLSQLIRLHCAECLLQPDQRESGGIPPACTERTA